jgi:hypothetical protein
MELGDLLLSVGLLVLCLLVGGFLATRIHLLVAKGELDVRGAVYSRSATPARYWIVFVNAVVGAIMAFGIAAVVFTSLVTGGSQIGPDGGFDRDRWLKADLGTRERADMVEDLLKTHSLRGMHRAEIVALLGPPTLTDKWEGTEMRYVLGPDGSYTPIDNEWLLIELDRQDRVARYEVVPD